MFGSNMDKPNRKNCIKKIKQFGWVTPFLTQTWVETTHHLKNVLT